VNRAELQARIHQHIATAVAAACEDIAEYAGEQVKAAVVPPVVRQRGEPAAIVHLGERFGRRGEWLKPQCAFALLVERCVAPDRAAEVTCYDCRQILHNAGAGSRNTSQPPHNTERPA
jgi:hypothetical protein